MAAALIDRVGEGFREAFGRDPNGIWSAPGRVSVAGDHTDTQDGLSFGFATAERTAVAVARRDDGTITVATDLTDERATADLATLRPDAEPRSWKAYPLGMIWAVVEYARQRDRDEAGHDPNHVATDALAICTGLDVFISTDLPVGGGLASSASACAAVGIALSDMWHLDCSDETLADLGLRAEVAAAGAAGGVADHFTVLAATAGHDVFFDVRGRDVSLIETPDLAGAGLVTLTVGTNELHRNWSDPFRERQEACQRVAEALGVQSLREVRLQQLEAIEAQLDPTDLRRARYVITEIQRTLDLTRILRTEGPEHSGPTLRASQASLRDDFEVSTERIDAVCELADRAGAIGARMSGSGLGGSVFIVIPADAVDRFTEACVAHFDERGWGTPDVREVTPCDGPRRDV
ncbi:galactokinase [Pseudoclavibacter endophyticus]|uniref:Galactokinase n=1 Tax=Pseudoclavibacter endophyticus TaxID=1778590 RepID=A0A6H9WQX8_9MICO|nr:galactokinase family protein [Pseudoclavibacter endophyticus]KAB1649357.1 galactokinase [Pseudoclavibacter endophyticus]